MKKIKQGEKLFSWTVAHIWQAMGPGLTIMIHPYSPWNACFRRELWGFHSSEDLYFVIKYSGFHADSNIHHLFIILNKTIKQVIFPGHVSHHCTTRFAWTTPTYIPDITSNSRKMWIIITSNGRKMWIIIPQELFEVMFFLWFLLCSNTLWSYSCAITCSGEVMWTGQQVILPLRLLPPWTPAFLFFFVYPFSFSAELFKAKMDNACSEKLIMCQSLVHVE